MSAEPRKVVVAEMSRQLREGPAQSAIHHIISLDKSRYVPVPVFSVSQEEHYLLEQTIGMRASNYRMPRPRITLSPADLVRFASGTASASRALMKLIQKEHAALVHANSIINVHAAIAAGKAGVPLVLTVREILPDRSLNHNFIRMICGKADAVIAVSGAVKQRLLSGGADKSKITVIHNGIDIYPVNPGDADDVRRELGIAPDEKVVGMLGTIIEMKGHHVMLDAAEIIATRGGGKICIVVIGGPQEESLEYHAKMLERAAGLKGVVRAIFTGPRDDARRCMAAFDVFAQPSVVDDSLPRTVLEAMSSGVPVIGSRIGGIPEMIEDGVTGRIIPPGDAESLATAIMAMLSDDSKRASFGAASIEHVKTNFDRAAQTSKVMAIYDAVLSTKQ